MDSGDGLVDLVNDLVNYMDNMSQVTVHEAKTHLSRLLRRVAAGEEVVIARSGTPVARLVRIEHGAPRTLGRDRGMVQVPDDFDDLPVEIAEDFER